MKSMSVLAAVSIAVLAVACKKDDPASETFTTSAPVVQDQPAAQPQVTTGTTTTGAQGEPTTAAGVQKGKDAGIATDWPSGGQDLIDRGGLNKGAGMVPSEQTQPSVNAKDNAKDPNNHSTPLGDGKSGSYTDGKGTHGGKATWGTGPHKDTKMDQPTPAPAK